MKHIKIYEGFSNKRISDDIIDAIDILSNYNAPFDINVFESLEKINKMTKNELNEFYESVSTNRRQSNSDEENFMLDIINRFNLNTLDRFNESINEKMEWSKYFKILSIKYDDWKILKPGHIEFDECVKDCVENTYTKDPIEINSVQRISDGEIFTLGDMVAHFLSDNSEDYSEIGKITKIWPSFDQMRADVRKLGLVLNHKEIKVIN